MEGFSRDVKDGFIRVKYKIANILENNISPDTTTTIALVFSRKDFFSIPLPVALSLSHWSISDLYAKTFDRVDLSSIR